MALEFALVLPILVVFLFGIIDVGLHLSDRQAMQSGVRSAARSGIVAEFDPSATCAITGTPSTAATGQLVCMTKNLVDLDKAQTRVRIVVSGSTAVPGASLTICVQYPARSRTGAFGYLLDGRTIQHKAEMRIEQASDVKSFSEPPLLASGWKC